MSNCYLEEDLKALEPDDLAARQDIKQAIEDHITDFNSKNSSAQSSNPSKWGIKITPAAPKFHAGFPSHLQVPLVRVSIAPPDDPIDIDYNL